MTLPFELQRLLLSNVRPTGKQLGIGSYGRVEELEVNKLLCAGKRLHDVLLNPDNQSVVNIERRYFEECKVMAEMRHPNIVQFLGLCLLEGSTLPVLVMERLDSSLDELLESAPGLPLALKRSLLVNVAQGLLYLHTHNPPVVHRDLSAQNILLTSSLVAKISDLGNARIVDLWRGQLAKTLTHPPGAWVYMPPEAFDEGSQYGPQLDIFSFGQLTLFTLTQVFPGSLLPITYEDPQSPGSLLARSELERRRNYIKQLHKQLGKKHLLVSMVHQCLHNAPHRRPSATELLEQLEAVRAPLEGPYGQIMKLSVDIEKVRVLRKKDSEIKHLQQQLEEVKKLLQAELDKVRKKDAEINQLQTELQTLREQTASVRCNHLSPSSETYPPSEPPIQPRWTKCSDMEHAMSAYPCLVILERKIYVGGGRALEKSAACTIQVYDMDRDEWSSLPKYQYKYFGMTVINSSLTVVGGKDTCTKNVTSQLAAFDPKSNEWTRPYPPMPTPRRDPTVCTYRKWLLVAGGRICQVGGALSTVELLDTFTKQWQSVSPLPVPCYFILSTILENNWYFITRDKQAFHVSLPDIVSQADTKSTTSRSPTLWCRLPDTPLKYSAIIAFQKVLLAVGGRDHDGKSSTAIHLYQPENEKWTKFADLPSARYYCSCTVLPNNELLVAGGNKSSDQYTSRVDRVNFLH